MKKKKNIKGNDAPSPESKQRNQRHRRRIRSHLSLFEPFRDWRLLYPHHWLGSPLIQLQPCHSPPQQSRFFYFYSYSYSFTAQPIKLDEVRVRVGSVTAGPSQVIKGARLPVLASPLVAGRSVAVDYTSTWELLKSFAPLEDVVVAPNTTRLEGYAETTSSSSSSSTS